MSRLQKVVKGILLYYKYQPLILTKKNSFIALFFHLNVSNETTCSNFKVSWRGRPMEFVEFRGIIGSVFQKPFWRKNFSKSRPIFNTTQNGLAYAHDGDKKFFRAVYQVIFNFDNFMIPHLLILKIFIGKDNFHFPCNCNGCYQWQWQYRSLKKLIIFLV